jgi:hypothetical protein
MGLGGATAKSPVDGDGQVLTHAENPQKLDEALLPAAAAGYCLFKFAWKEVKR